MRVTFGEFVLDRGTRQLWRGQEERRVGPTAFQLLELLLSRRPNVVAKEGIRDHLWPGTFVSGSTLATVVTEVRSALDDDPKRPRFLRTVHGVGYAFCGPASEDSAPPPSVSAPVLSYWLLLAGREVALHQGENLLGRTDEGVAWIESQSVSRRHARVVVQGDRAILEDLGSKNGTFVSGQRISGAVLLADGAQIRLGQVKMTLRIMTGDRATRTDEGQ